MKDLIIFLIQKMVWSLCHIFWIFPIKQDRIIFESYSGKQISCNPLSIYLHLKKSNIQMEFVWSVKSYHIKNSECSLYVKRNTIKYFYYLLTAKVFISNNCPQGYLPFRKKQLTISTWHGGGAYKKMGVSMSSGKCQYKIHRMIANNTKYAIASCRAFESAFRQGYLVDESKYLRIGMPRNDVFFNTDAVLKNTDKVKRHLSLDKNAFVVLYAPTWRNSFKTPSFDLLLDCDMLVNVVKSKYRVNNVVVLFRGHHLFNNLLGNKDAAFSSMINVSAYPDMQELLCAADMLISDYSSVVWDYSFLYRPCFLFVPDIDKYSNNQGYYTPIAEWGFPLAESNMKLYESICSFDEKKYRIAMEEHHINLGSYETGKASELFCDLLMDKINCQ